MKRLRESVFYKKHLRGRRSVHFVGRIYYEFTEFGVIGLTMRWGRLPWREVQDPAAGGGTAGTAATSVTVPPFVFHSHLDCDALRQPDVTMDVAAARVARYRKATVIGGSEMVLPDGGHAVIDSNYRPDEDLAPLEMHRRLQFSDDFGRLKARVRTTRHMESGISLLSPHSTNFMHFVTEVLPKAVLADDLPSSLPWLVDANVSDGLLAFLTYAVRAPRRMLKVGAWRAARVGDLYVPYAESRVQFDSRFGGIVSESPRTYFNPGLLGRVRRNARRTSSRGEGLKVYFRRDLRTASGRLILNQDDLEDLLRRNGFVVVDPGRMTPQEQIDVAGRATVIVGSMGAALTNMVWADPGTRVIGIAGFLPGANYGLFPSLAAAMGHDFHFVIGEMRGAGVASELNYDIWVDLDALAQVVQA